MEQYPAGEEQEELLDLNEVMQAFGVSEWSKLETIVETAATERWSALLDIQGQRYILREQPEGLVSEDSNHRIAFRHFLQQAGIPLPALWLTPQGEPMVVIGDTSFELEQEAMGDFFNTSA
ncbi:MAG TPA: hypothetical protein DIU08_10085, partial [Ktedonobacter sp.]|nr:hypothetical protein [Ktedonobacter sp.]